MTIAKAIARAWRDAGYRERLNGDPRAALAEAGVEIPAGVTVKVLSDTQDTVHLVLPVHPGKDLSPEALEKIAAGADLSKVNSQVID